MSRFLCISQQVSVMYKKLLPFARALSSLMQPHHKFSCTGNVHQTMLSMLCALNDP